MLRIGRDHRHATEGGQVTLVLVGFEIPLKFTSHKLMLSYL